MTLQDFKKSLHLPTPPETHRLLKALWYDAQGDWDKAHDLTQEDNTSNGSWIHAFLHRKEGDRSNALYWYNRANQNMPTYSLEQEWDELVTYLLKEFQ
jgi:hypothetical protein